MNELIERDGIFYPKWMIDVFDSDPPPKNPLREKWMSYATPKPEYSQVCDGYSCMFCGRCPLGDYWKVPEEDKEEYDKYLSKMKEWEERHSDMVGDSALSQIMIPFNTPEEGDDGVD